MRRICFLVALVFCFGSTLAEEWDFDSMPLEELIELKNIVNEAIEKKQKDSADIVIEKASAIGSQHFFPYAAKQTGKMVDLYVMIKSTESPKETFHHACEYFSDINQSITTVTGISVGVHFMKAYPDKREGIDKERAFYFYAGRTTPFTQKHSEFIDTLDTCTTVFLGMLDNVIIDDPAYQAGIY